MNELIERSGASASATDLAATIRLIDPPSSAAERSDLIDSAYEEFCQRVESGEPIDADEYCARYPAFQTSLRRLLQAHQNLEENPELLNDLTTRWPEPGEPFLGYRLLSELGRGAFARVFLAQELAVGGRLVAVKLSLHDDHEADTLGRLHHPNIVPIFSVQQDSMSGFSVVCMPFLGGTTLCHVIDQARAVRSGEARGDVLLHAARDARWPGENAPAPHVSLIRGSYIDGVLHLVERLSNALQYVHSQGVIHRDLKPSNILICPNGVPVLLDFNLALDREVNDYRLGGTLPYMPPEQLQAIVHRRAYRASSADARTDLYGLGVILYELLAGAHPFGPVPAKLSTLQARDWLLARQKQGPRPIQELNPEVDAGLAAFAMRCIANDVDSRPANADEFLAALQRFQSPRLRARRWARANWRSLTAASVLALVPIAAAGHYLATLPPKAVRNASAGHELAKAGRLADAVKAYTISLEADEDQPAVRFARGRTYMQLCKWEKAVIDFEAADPNRRDAQSQACLAFCFAAQALHERAIECSDDAIAGGFDTAAVVSNRAFSLQESGRFQEAVEEANRALIKRPGLAQAYLTRGSARRGLAERPDGDPKLFQMAFDDFQVALTAGLSSKETLMKAASAAAYTLKHGESNPKIERAVFDLSRKALERGWNRHEAERDPLLGPYVQMLSPDIVPIGPAQSAVDGLIDPL